MALVIGYDLTIQGKWVPMTDPGDSASNANSRLDQIESCPIVVIAMEATTAEDDLFSAFFL